MKKENISTMFLLPGIQIKPELKQKFYSFGFRNTYLTCKPFTYPFEVIYLLFQPEALDVEFYAFTEELQKNTNFIEILDMSDRKVMLVYRVPRKFKRDYELFLDGRYSQTSKDFQACFAMEDYKRNEKGLPIRGKDGRPEKVPTTFYHVFNRTPFLQQKWKDRLGYDYDSDILDGMELYEKQDPLKEALEVELDW
jgi:hypothetical protein